MDSWAATVFVVCILAWFAVAVGIGIRRLARASVRAMKPGVTGRVSTPRGAFPVVTLTTDNVRRYRIVGVDSQTRADLDFVIDAATAANAKVKAELAGVIVTEVEEATKSAK